MIIYRYDMYNFDNTWKGPNDETVIWALGFSFLFFITTFVLDFNDNDDGEVKSPRPANHKGKEKGTNNSFTVIWAPGMFVLF